MDFHAQYESVKAGHITEQAILKRNQDKITEIETQKALNVKALAVIDKAIQVISANGIGKVESLVSDGLKLVFDQDLKLVIERKEGARGDSYRLMVQEGDVIGPPIDTMGGGVVNVISFLLRVIMIQRFKLSKFLALDESFNNVGDAHIVKVSEMLRTLCQEHGFSILVVTHQPLLGVAADRVYEVKGPRENPELVELASSL